MNQITVRQVGDVAVVDLVGRFCPDPTSDFLPTIQQLLDAGERKIVVNIARATYMDEAGIGQIAAAMKLVMERTGRLRLCGKEVPQVHGGHFAWLYATEEEAIASF